jgi:hypothetical protein
MVQIIRTWLRLKEIIGTLYSLEIRMSVYVFVEWPQLGVAKRAEPVGPTRLTRNFWRAGLRFSARYLKFARTRLARLENGRGRVGAGMPAGIVIVIFYFFFNKNWSS